MPDSRNHKLKLTTILFSAAIALLNIALCHFRRPRIPKAGAIAPKGLGRAAVAPVPAQAVAVKGFGGKAACGKGGEPSLQTCDFEGVY